MTEKKEEKFEVVRVLCLGYTDGGNGKLLIKFQKLNGSARTNMSGACEAKLFRTAAPGAVYTIEMSEDSVRPSSLKYVERYDNESVVAEIVTLSDAQRAAVDVRRRENKDKNQDHIYECLAPLRRAYQRADSYGRLIIEVRVLRALKAG